MGLSIFSAEAKTPSLGNIHITGGYEINIDNTVAGPPTAFDDKFKMSGFISPSPMVQGVFQSDKPDSYSDSSTTPRLRDYMLQKFNIPHDEDWHLGPDRQVFHFLRNRLDGVADKLDSAKNTCNVATARIAVATEMAIALLKARDQTSTVNGLFLLGHALHIIQDSFSEAHTRRQGASLKVIVDICYFGAEIEKSNACRHDDSIVGPDIGVGGNDWIWDTPNGESPADMSPGQMAKLKPTARIASFASAGYLLAIKDIIDNSMNVNDSLNEYFTGSYKKFIIPDNLQGFFDCSKNEDSI